MNEAKAIVKFENKRLSMESEQLKVDIIVIKRKERMAKMVFVGVAIVLVISVLNSLQF